MRPELRGGIVALVLAGLMANPAHADLPDQPTLTGDWNGTRTQLEDKGIQLGADEIAEVLGNPAGGAKQGAIFEGRFEVFATIDLGRALGWPGMTFHANAYQIHGDGLTAHDIANLVTVSNIEAGPATRLFDLWLQQSLFDDALSLRFGQIAADDEFFTSQYAPLFISSTFGWPSIMGINLPSGGPAYPIARPGARARLALSPRMTVQAAVFSGDPVADDTGFDFHMNGDVFAIGELAYAASVFELPGMIKLGAWTHTGRFPDQRFDASHVSLADPSSSGIPARHRGDYGGYVIVDQLLWRRAGDSDAGLGGFLRLGGDPSDRDRIEFHADGGLSYAAPFGRANDTLGLGMSYEQVSSGLRDLAKDAQVLDGIALPTPDFESVLELSYQAQLAPWWILQPDLQWVMHPGGRVPDLSRPRAIPDAVVLGLRTAMAL